MKERDIANEAIISIPRGGCVAITIIVTHGNSQSLAVIVALVKTDKLIARTLHTKVLPSLDPQRQRHKKCGRCDGSRPVKSVTGQQTAEEINAGDEWKARKRPLDADAMVQSRSGSRTAAI